MIGDVKKLNVKYNGKTVGYLATFENEKIGFQYENVFRIFRGEKI